MNKRYARWYKRQIPQPVQQDMIDYQRKNGYYPEQSILNGTYVDTYVYAPDITTMRRHDRDLMILSDAAGDHNYSAISRMWSAETTFMLFYIFSPEGFIVLLRFLCYWGGVMFSLWAFELLFGSKPVIVFCLWLWGYIASRKWITLSDIVENEYNYNGKYDFALKVGRNNWKRDFGMRIYNRIIGAARLHLTIFNKWIGVIITLLSVMYLSETDIHPDRFRVFDWLFGWFFALVHITWLVLFKLIPIYIIMGWEWLFY